MNRRSLLGFACGGLIAAPAAMLVGECPSNGRLGTLGEIGHEVQNLPTLKWVTIVDTRVRDEHLRRLVDQGTREALARNGFGFGQVRYTAQKG